MFRSGCGFVVGVVCAFVCAHAQGQATFITGTDANLCSYSQTFAFFGVIPCGLFFSHLV